MCLDFLSGLHIADYCGEYLPTLQLKLQNNLLEISWQRFNTARSWHRYLVGWGWGAKRQGGRQCRRGELLQSSQGETQSTHWRRCCGNPCEGCCSLDQHFSPRIEAAAQSTGWLQTQLSFPKNDESQVPSSLRLAVLTPLMSQWSKPVYTKNVKVSNSMFRFLAAWWACPTLPWLFSREGSFSFSVSFPRTPMSFHFFSDT